MAASSSSDEAGAVWLVSARNKLLAATVSLTLAWADRYWLRARSRFDGAGKGAPASCVRVCASMNCTPVPKRPPPGGSGLCPTDASRIAAFTESLRSTPRLRLKSADWAEDALFGRAEGLSARETGAACCGRAAKLASAMIAPNLLHPRQFTAFHPLLAIC